LYTLEAEGVVGEIRLQAAGDPGGNTVQCELRERESKMREVAEVQEGVPLSFGELLQGLRIGSAKLKRSE
jgi:hypothetical protein